MSKSKKKTNVTNTSFASTINLNNAIAMAIGLLLCIAALVAAKSLFVEEFTYFFNWCVAITLMGIVFLPVSYCIFKNYSDLGWIFSKVIGIAVSGWLMWYLSSLHILKFTRTSCIIAITLCLIGNIVLLYFKQKKKEIKISFDNISFILLIEGIFLVMFVFWMYLKGFNPKAYGTTEKLMDFGFMESMFKSEYMPPEDMWLSGESINYYYVGLFIATYITKVCNCGVEYGYNFMLMMIAAMGVAMPVSIIFNVARDRAEAADVKSNVIAPIFPYAAAGLAGVALTFTSNLHYLIYAKFIPWVRIMLGLDKLAEETGYKFPNYWFPNATRYIGYDPATSDKTIHEFPLYSFVLGDLHAHVINIIFVLTVVAVLYAYLQYRKHKMEEARVNGIFATEGENTKLGIPDFYKEIFHPCIIMTGFFIGLFHTTNFWDFPIYFVVAGAIILFSNAVIYNFSWNTLKLTAFHALVVLFISKLTCLPFTLNFHQISTSVRLCENRTPLYQLTILWGLPIIITIVFFVALIKSQKDKGIYNDNSISYVGKNSFVYRFIGNLEIHDPFILTIGLCAFGLVLIPEVIYVKDIYSGAYKRANTMFKLTYQAYILFSLVMSYVIVEFIFFTKKTGRRIFALICCILLVMTVGYFENSTKAWFGDWSDEEKYIGLNAGEYLKDVNEEDYLATNWINENIEGRPVMLEVNGDSYTDYCRVSIRTGLPTLLGWRTHEWLWQSDASGGVPEIVTTRTEVVETIYTSTDINEVKSLIEEYNIEYIYVGSLERDTYETEVNHSLLQSLGEVVYPAAFNSANSKDTTYIIKIK